MRSSDMCVWSPIHMRLVLVIENDKSCFCDGCLVVCQVAIVTG